MTVCVSNDDALVEPKQTNTPLKQGISQGPSIAVSSCLLGHRVRYDGNHKQHDLIREHICQRYQCITICPEFSTGLGVPRPTIQLIRTGNEQIRAIQAQGEGDVSDKLLTYAGDIARIYKQLSGYIFKARSPSCAVGSAPVVDQYGKEVGVSSGLFAQHIIAKFPEDFPVSEETELDNIEAIAAFSERVEHYFYAHQPARIEEKPVSI